MIRFIRNRSECNKGGPQSNLIFGLGVHALRSDKALTLEEIMQEHETYSQQFPETTVPTWSQLLQDLSINISMGLVDVVDDTDRTHGVWVGGRFTSHEAIEDITTWANLSPEQVKDVYEADSMQVTLPTFHYANNLIEETIYPDDSYHLVQTYKLNSKAIPETIVGYVFISPMVEKKSIHLFVDLKDGSLDVSKFRADGPYVIGGRFNVASNEITLIWSSVLSSNYIKVSYETEKV